MVERAITTSYKLDPACFCCRRKDLIDFSKALLSEGFMIGVAMASLLSLHEYNGMEIDEICSVSDDAKKRYIIDGFIEENGYPDELREKVISVMPVMSDMLIYIHNNGFFEYWNEGCLPGLTEKCSEYMENAEGYPVVTKVNEILGSKSIKSPKVTLYLSYFSAPYGIGLRNAYISDIRWNFENTVAIALHELIHPPFDRKRIREMADIISKDEFFMEAKIKLPVSSGYHNPEDFLEENTVEGTHIYLSEVMGVEEDPLGYLLEHDYGSRVISAVIYNALKNGMRSHYDSIEEVVEALLSDESLKTGKIKEVYDRIYKEKENEVKN